MIFLDASVVLHQENNPEDQPCRNVGVNNKGGLTFPQLHSQNVRSSIDGSIIHYADSSDDETGTRPYPLTKAPLHISQSVLDSIGCQMRLKDKNIHSIPYPSSLKKTNSTGLSSTPQDNEGSFKNDNDIEKAPISPSNSSLIATSVQRDDESQKKLADLRGQSRRLLKYHQIKGQYFSSVRSEIDGCRDAIKEVEQRNSIENQIKKRSLLSSHNESEEEIMLQSFLLDDEHELDYISGQNQSQKGFWSAICCINVLLDYIIWYIRKLNASPKFEMFIITLCFGLLLYTADLFSDIVNGIILLYNGRKFSINFKIR